MAAPMFRSPIDGAGTPPDVGQNGQPEGEQRPDDEDRWQSLKAVYFAFNLALTAAGTISNVLACGQAPVAVVFPLSVAAGLSSNLVLQQYLRLAEYDKNARVGTSILVIAVILIARLGPTELPANADMLALISTPQAGVFIGVNLVVMAGSMSALFFQWARARNNAVELLLFTLVGGTGTVLNASISKLAQMHVTAPVRLSLLAVYMHVCGFF
ncbi:unnamed protein product [Prorocentrum cordatum]|uniref:Magnesium transporter n=1 Tax=Prorocentrum cordatum TaxID=2364126 RepID=A0ABN9PQS7_9DINO|nr:unnamed protein product [Polarella glacialis]